MTTLTRSPDGNDRTADWNVFASHCREEFHLCTFQDELIAECGGREDIAWAAYYHLGDYALKWLHYSIPALGRKVPIDLIRSGQMDQVRDCLWSMP